MRVDRNAVDDDWRSITELASLRGVSKQAISKRVKALAARRELPVRGEGRSLRVHAPTFDQLCQATHDPAQDLRNRHQKASSPAPPPAEPDAAPKAAKAVSAYDDASTREKNARAELAEMQLAQRRGELLRARDIEHAAVEVGTAIAQRITALKTKAGQLYAAGATGGEDAVHVLLVEIVNATLTGVAESMSKLKLAEQAIKAND